MKPPKTITAKIVVPEWAKWVATDKSGSIFAYNQQPKDGTVAYLPTGGRCEQLGFTTPPRNWRKTLRRVK